MSRTAPPDDNNGLLEDPRYVKFKKRLRKDYSGGPALLFGEGNPQANVCIVGLRPELTEKNVFSGDEGKVLRDLISKRIGVPSFAVWYTYVVKQPGVTSKIPTWGEVREWCDYLFDELEIIKPRATVLMGVETAWAVLGSEEADTEKLRHIRFMLKRAIQTNFFVTYSAENLNRFGIHSQVGVSMEEDLRAIFEVIVSHFTSVQKI